MRLFVYEFVSAGGLGPAAAPSLRREGWAMLAAAADDFARVAGARVWTLLEDGELPPVGHVCCRTTADAEADQFRALAGRADATLVIAPEFDDHLATRSAWVLAAGGRLLGSAPAAVRLAGDKWALARHWARRGVPTPRTSRLPAARPLRFPAVCKPRHGAGSQATFLVRRRADWPAAYEEARAAWAGDLVVQPYVADGLAASVALLLGPGRCVPLVPAAQHLSDDGRFRYEGGQVPLAPRWAAPAVALARRAVADVAGLGGYVGVDLLLGEAADGSGDVAIEINPRLTTSYLGLRRLYPGNLADLWLRTLAGEDVPPVAWHPGRVRFAASGDPLDGP